jgi:hypothetical protein
MHQLAKLMACFRVAKQFSFISVLTYVCVSLIISIVGYLQSNNDRHPTAVIMGFGSDMKEFLHPEIRCIHPQMLLASSTRASDNTYETGILPKLEVEP